MEYYLPFHILRAIPLSVSISITLPKVSVVAAYVLLGDKHTDKPSRLKSGSPNLQNPWSRKFTWIPYWLAAMSQWYMS